MRVVCKISVLASHKVIIQKSRPAGFPMPTLFEIYALSKIHDLCYRIRLNNDDLLKCFVFCLRGMFQRN